MTARVLPPQQVLDVVLPAHARETRYAAQHVNTMMAWHAQVLQRLVMHACSSIPRKQACPGSQNHSRISLFWRVRARAPVEYWPSSSTEGLA